MEINHLNLKTKLEIVSKPDLERLHEKYLQILSETGVIFHNEEAFEIFKKHGTKITGKTVYFSKKELEGAPCIFSSFLRFIVLWLKIALIDCFFVFHQKNK